jgi:hypothetical protein
LACARGSPYSRPTIVRFSRPVRFSSTAAYWPARPIRSRSFAASRDDVEPGDARVPRVGLQQRRQDADDRRLARAVRPEQAEHGARSDVEIDARERRT